MRPGVRNGEQHRATGPEQRGGVGGDRDIETPRARDLAGVLSERRMSGPLEGSDHAEVRRVPGERDAQPAHPSRGAGDDQLDHGPARSAPVSS